MDSASNQHETASNHDPVGSDHPEGHPEQDHNDPKQGDSQIEEVSCKIAEAQTNGQSADVVDVQNDQENQVSKPKKKGRPKKSKKVVPIKIWVTSKQIYMASKAPEKYRKSLRDVFKALNTIKPSRVIPKQSINDILYSTIEIIDQLNSDRKEEQNKLKQQKYEVQDDVHKLIEVKIKKDKTVSKCLFNKCGKTFDSFKMTRKHIRKDHLHMHLRPEEGEYIRLTECEYCGDHFTSAKIWKHRKEAHPDKPQLLYQCLDKNCTFAHEKKDKYLVHLKTEHPDVRYIDSATFTPKKKEYWYSLLSEKKRKEYSRKWAETKRLKLLEAKKAKVRGERTTVTIDTDETIDCSQASGEKQAEPQASTSNEISFQDVVNVDEWADRMAEELISNDSSSQKDPSVPDIGDAEKRRRYALSFIGRKPIDHKVYEGLIVKPDFLETCQTCGKSFDKNYEFVVHNPCYGRRNGYYEELKSWYPEVKCEVCSLTFKGIFHLKSHMIYHLDKLWSCAQCGHKFYNDQTSRDHIDGHLGSKKFFCTFKKNDGTECGIEFKNIASAERHIYADHWKSFPYNCPTCNKGFPKKSVMDEHIEEIHGEGHKCPAVGCNYSSGRKHVLRKHVMVKHPEMDVDFKKLNEDMGMHTSHTSGKLAIKRGCMVLVERPEPLEIVHQKHSKLGESQVAQIQLKKLKPVYKRNLNDPNSTRKPGRRRKES